jgi:hypothetical protein
MPANGGLFHGGDLPGVQAVDEPMDFALAMVTILLGFGLVEAQRLPGMGRAAVLCGDG